MQELSIEQTLQRIKNGNELAREELIENHKPFIIKISSNLCDSDAVYTYDSDASLEMYKEEEQTNDFAETVKRYVLELANYGIVLEDLVQVSPKRRDSKATLYRVAHELCAHPELSQYLTKHKCLPLKELELLTGIKRKVLERGRKYLIATVLVLSAPEFKSLKSFTQIDSITQKEGLA